MARYGGAANVGNLCGVNRNNQTKTALNHPFDPRLIPCDTCRIAPDARKVPS